MDDQNASLGALTALNNSLLATSSFYTGAFSPEYGNVLSSVMDIRLRKGNNEKSYVSEPETIYPYLSKLLTAVEITKDSAGNPVLGFVSLHTYSDSYLCISLREKKGEAESETAVGLEKLLKMAGGDALALPKQEPFYTKGYCFTTLTEIGRALQNGLDSLVKEKAKSITAANILSVVEEVKQEAERRKAEAGEKYSEASNLITATELEIKAKVGEINYDGMGFVEAEISQAYDALNQAKDNLKNLAYENAKSACETAVKIAGNLQELIGQRSAAKKRVRAAKDEALESLSILQKGNFTDKYFGADEEDRQRAGTLQNEINAAYENGQYDVVLQKVEEAKTLLAEIEARLKQAESGAPSQSMLEMLMAKFNI